MRGPPRRPEPLSTSKGEPCSSIAVSSSSDCITPDPRLARDNTALGCKEAGAISAKRRSADAWANIAICDHGWQRCTADQQEVEDGVNRTNDACLEDCRLFIYDILAVIIRCHYRRGPVVVVVPSSSLLVVVIRSISFGDTLRLDAACGSLIGAPLPSVRAGPLPLRTEGVSAAAHGHAHAKGSHNVPQDRRLPTGFVLIEDR